MNENEKLPVKFQKFPPNFAVHNANRMLVEHSVTAAEIIERVHEELDNGDHLASDELLQKYDNHKEHTAHLANHLRGSKILKGAGIGFDQIDSTKTRFHPTVTRKHKK